MVYFSDSTGTLSEYIVYLLAVSNRGVHRKEVCVRTCDVLVQLQISPIQSHHHRRGARASLEISSSMIHDGMYPPHGGISHDGYPSIVLYSRTTVE